MDLHKCKQAIGNSSNKFLFGLIFLALTLIIVGFFYMTASFDTNKTYHKNR